MLNFCPELEPALPAHRGLMGLIATSFFGTCGFSCLHPATGIAAPAGFTRAYSSS
jgi:hypothetical protein